MGEIKRREFVGGACATLATAAMLNPAEVLASTNDPVMQSFKRVTITGADGQPLKAASIAAGEYFVFNYPYVSSPAFLINSDGQIKPSGAWGGGVGAAKSVVAFAAICSHLLSYPKASLSALSYRHKKEGQYATKDRVITCCAHGSVYDVDAGGAKVSGPATAGLAAIVLEHDAATDALTATGVYGAPWIHKKFLTRMKKDLKKVYGRSGYKAEAEGSVQIKKLTDITSDISKC